MYLVRPKHICKPCFILYFCSRLEYSPAFLHSGWNTLLHAAFRLEYSSAFLHSGWSTLLHAAFRLEYSSAFLHSGWSTLLRADWTTFLHFCIQASTLPHSCIQVEVLFSVQTGLHSCISAFRLEYSHHGFIQGQILSCMLSFRQLYFTAFWLEHSTAFRLWSIVLHFCIQAALICIPTFRLAQYSSAFRLAEYPSAFRLEYIRQFCIQAKVTSALLHSSKRCLLHAWIQERTLSCMLHSGKCMHLLRLGYSPEKLHSSRNTTASLHSNKSILFCNMHSEYCSSYDAFMNSVYSAVWYSGLVYCIRQESWCNAPHEQYHVNNIHICIDFCFLLESKMFTLTGGISAAHKRVYWITNKKCYFLPVFYSHFSSLYIYLLSYIRLYCWGRINERTISLRSLGIILRVLQLEVSVHNVYITSQFQPTFALRGVCE
jgi:hypothetical protein